MTGLREAGDHAVRTEIHVLQRHLADDKMLVGVACLGEQCAGDRTQDASSPPGRVAKEGMGRQLVTVQDHVKRTERVNQDIDDSGELGRLVVETGCGPKLQ